MKSRGRRGPRGSGKFSAPFTTGDTSALHTDTHRHIVNTLKLTAFAWSKQFPPRQARHVLQQRVRLQRAAASNYDLGKRRALAFKLRVLLCVGTPLMQRWVVFEPQQRGPVLTRPT